MTLTIDLTDAGVRDQAIRDLLDDGLPQRQIATMFRISQQQVSRLARGKTTGRD